MERTVSHTNVQLPHAKAIAHVIVRGALFPLVRHDGKVCLPLDGIAHAMRLSIDTMAVIAQCQNAFQVVTLNIVETSRLGAPGLPSERTTAAKVMPLESVGFLLAVLALVPTYEQDARNLARLVKQLIAELAKIEKATPPAPSAAEAAQAGVDATHDAAKTVALRVSVSVEGGTPELNTALGNLLLRGLDDIPGTQTDTGEAAPSPTRH
jgi:hypothetical protein